MRINKKLIEVAARVAGVFQLRRSLYLSSADL